MSATTSENPAGTTAAGAVPRHADALVIGAGLSGLVAANELVQAGKSVIVIDQESRNNLGGQAFWSFGGLFLVDSPEQRRMGIKDSLELAWSDWEGTAAFDRPEDYWPREWARAYVEWAAGEKRTWIKQMGLSVFPIVGWAERGDGRADGRGNSVPRFHVTWGTGPGVVLPFVDKAIAAEAEGRLHFAHRHRVDELIVEDGAVVGVRGKVLAPADGARGVKTNRNEIADFELRGQAVIVTSGGIGGNHDLVRGAWPERLGSAPREMITGVPAYVDGRMLAISEHAGARLINRDRMWHYVEGIQNWDPIWPDHGIRILPGPSSMWFDATGRRLPAPYLPGFDTLGTLDYLRHTGHDHSWFITNAALAGKEFALSGSEQNLDLTEKSFSAVAKRPITKVPPAVQAFIDKGVDFVHASTVAELVTKMNALTPEPLLDAAEIERQIEARDLQTDNPFTKDAQIMAIQTARHYRGDKLTKRAHPIGKVTDPKQRPLIAVKLHILTRKTLGGLETDLSARVLDSAGQPLPGLYAAGEVAGFGGGGMHGYAALEGTFLGGCLFSGRTAGRAAARAI